MKTENIKCTCEKCELRSLFFSHVTLEDLTDICEIKYEISHKKGDIILREGDPINEFIYLKEGLVKLSKETADGRDQILSFSKPFDFVSLLSIFSSERYHYTVTAIDDSVTCLLDLNVVKRQAQENPMFTMDLMMKLSQISDSIITENLDIKRKHLRGRVAHVLIYFSKQVYDKTTFELPVSRREIAEYIGMTTENVIRTLSEFRKDKIIKIYGKYIEIADLKRLENISEFG